MIKSFRKKMAVEKELKVLQKKEEKMQKTAARQSSYSWKNELEKKVPDKVYKNLKAAFGKAR